MQVHFSKMHGLGNDFVVIDSITQNIFLSKDRIKELADRHTGIGFDQLLLVEPPYDPDVDFHYRIFNADGGEVAQCGNGARCFAYFVHHKKLTHKKKITVSTQSGKMLLILESDQQVTVNMGIPQFIPDKIPFKAQQQENMYLLRISETTILCGVVSMGNPHCVTIVDDLEETDVLNIGTELESHERFPERVNVGFMQILDRNRIRLRVFERGVGETQACGSGACAAVAVGQKQGLLDQAVHVELTGGNLFIQWKGEAQSLFMKGPVKHVFDGIIDIN